MLKWISLFLIAVCSTAFWFAEVIYRNWDGLNWISYFHIGYLVAPLLFLLWIISFNLYYPGRGKAVFHFTVIYFFYFLISVIALSAFFITGPGAALFYNENTYQYRFLGLISAILIYVFVNIFLIKTRGRNAKVSDLVFIILGIFLIPVVSWITSIPLLSIVFKVIFSDRNPNYILEYAGDPIHWFKTGSIIFGTVLYEGVLVILYNRKRNLTTSST